MSQENVEIVRAGFEIWNAQDMDAFRDLLHSDVVLRNPEGWPEPGPFVGREAVMDQLEQSRAIWDHDELEPIGEFIEAGGCVFIRDVWHGRGRSPDADMEFTHVFTMRKGLISFVEIYWDHAEALEAVGLRE
jgi:ketosteroid isomerase-like protein